MSLHARLYTFVRNFRQKHPVCGCILAFSMNLLLFLQIFHYSYAYYVYIFIVCHEMINSQVQVCIYMAVFHTLLLMLSWSLFQVLITPVKSPPPEFKVPSQYHDLICRNTPKDDDGNLILDKPTKNQIKVLEYVRDCLNLGNDMAEIDFEGRLRYCYVCKAFKPDRARHCSSCGKCVLRLDHHCPWLNKCISHSNYKFFLLFNFYAFALNTWLLLTSIGPMFAFIYNISRSEQAIQVFQLGISLASQAYFGFYTVGGLALYHVVLCSENETTCERAKAPVFRGDECASYNCGVYENYQLILGYKFWLFPIKTTFDDGVHFPISYCSQSNPEMRYVLCEKVPTIQVSSNEAIENGTAKDFSQSSGTTAYWTDQYISAEEIPSNA